MPGLAANLSEISLVHSSVTVMMLVVLVNNTCLRSYVAVQ